MLVEMHKWLKLLKVLDEEILLYGRLVIWRKVENIVVGVRDVKTYIELVSNIQWGNML